MWYFGKQALRPRAHRFPRSTAGAHSDAPGVVLVLIASPVAQMTTTFEKVKEMSNAYRLFQKVHLIGEFKQYHDTP